MEEMPRARCGEGRGAPPRFRASLSPNLHVFNNPEAPGTPSFWGSLEGSLHRHDW